LVDALWEGRQRKLLLNANRNGFFYVLDRTDGKLLLAKPFVQKLNWAREIGVDGRPVLNPEQRSSATGTRICPSLIGAANWWSTAFDPATAFYYVQALESCAIYTRRDAKQAKWEAGRGFAGGSSRESPDDRPQSSCAPSTFAPVRSPGNWPSQVPARRAAGCLRQRVDWSSFAPIATPSWPRTPRLESRSGTFRRTIS